MVPRKFSSDPAVDRSLRHSIRDGIAFSVMSGGAETYFSAFALFLRATTAQIGMLASLPPLLGAFAQLLSAWLGRRGVGRKAIILGGATLQGFVLLPMVALPLAFPGHAIALLIGCVAVFYAASNLAAPQWSSLMGDLVPERRRGRYFALRTRLASLTAFAALVGAGLTLHAFDHSGLTLGGYVLVFALAMAARFVSVYHLACMHDPPGHVAALEVPIGRGWGERLRQAPGLWFSAYFAAMQFAVAIAAPFFTVYMLRDLQFTYLQFMANTATSVLVQVLTLNIWGRVSDVSGNRLVLVATGSVIPLLPALWLVSADFWYLIAVQAVSGLVWAGFSLSAGNFIYDLVPAPRRATYLAVHNVLASVGIFLGALLGGYAGTLLAAHANLFGMDGWHSTLLGVFLLSALARLAVAAIFLPRLREVRAVRPMSVGGLVFRVVRFNALSGLFFDIVGARRRSARALIRRPMRGAGVAAEPAEQSREAESGRRLQVG